MLSTFSIDTLSILGSGVSNYALHEIEGLEAPEYRVSTYENPGEDGGTVGSEFYGSRPITLKGLISGVDAAAYVAARQSLATVCRIRKDSFGFPEPTTFAFTTESGASYFFNGYVRTFRAPLQRGKHGPFFISILVADPFIYATGELSSGQFARPAGGGYTYPIVYPITYGESSGGVATISNAGNAPVWPVITIRGAVTNPLITSLTRNKFMQLNYTAGPNDTIVIDMKARTIVLNGTTNLLYTKSNESDWFSLSEGDNVILFSTTSSGDTGTVEVTHYSAFLGV